MKEHISYRAQRIGLIAILAFVATPSLAAPFESWSAREQRVLALVNEQRAHHGLGALRADARLHDAAFSHSGDMLQDDFFAHDHPDGTTAAQRVTAAGYRWRATGENIAAGSGRQFRGAAVVESAPVDAAREVMYGTDNLADLASFAASRALGETAGYLWEDVGRSWSEADWEAWEQQRSGRGGWMGSTGHRGSILSDRYADIGVGYVFSGNDGGSVNWGTYWTQQFAAGDSAPEPDPEPEPQPVPQPAPPGASAPAALVPILELLTEEPTGG